MVKFIKGFLSIGAIIFLLYIFTFHIDGEMGAILIAFLVFPPLISLIIALISRKNINAEIKCDAYVKKGKKLLLNVSVHKSKYVSLSIVELHLFRSEVFDNENKVYRLSLLNENKTEFNIEIDSLIGGNGEVLISQIYCLDFLGFFKFKAPKHSTAPILVGVVPEIPEITASSQLFRNISSAVANDEIDDDNETTMMFSTNVVAGYEHRDYIQGDPIKRINWKLSARKGKMMVRLDEAAVTSQPTIILDLYRSGNANPEQAVLLEEKLLTSVFGLVSLLVKQGIACNFVYIGSSGEVEIESVDNPAYPMQLLLKILSIKVKTDRRIDISEQCNSSCAFIVATTDAGAGFKEVISKISNFENTSIIAPNASITNSTDLPLWYLDDDNNFNLV